MKSAEQLRDEIDIAIYEVFYRKIDFETEFLETRRKNGEIINGNPRDTVDLAVMLDSTFVTRLDLNAIEIQSTVFYAPIVMAERPELVEELIDEIDPEYIIANLIASRMQEFVI